MHARHTLAYLRNEGCRLYKSLQAAALQATKIQALTIAVQHPAVTPEPRDLCSLLQTSHSWRSALQQSAAGIAAVDAAACRKLRKLPAFANFAAWVQKHGGLLHTIQLQAPYCTVHGITKREFCTAVDEILAVAMAGAAPLLRLKCFSTIYLTRAAVLAALPVSSLTKLSFWVSSDSYTCDSRAIAGALVQLNRLRDLQCEFTS